MAVKKPFNPFYLLLVITGVVFCVTACAYGVMTVRGLHPDAPGSEASMLEWLDRHGFVMLISEVATLAVFTVAAIWTDSYWERIEMGSRSTDESEE